METRVHYTFFSYWVGCFTRFFFPFICFFFKSLGLEFLVNLKYCLILIACLLCQFICESFFSCFRCWELSAGDIKWIYQAPILAAIGVSSKAWVVFFSFFKGCMIKLLLKPGESLPLCSSKV